MARNREGLVLLLDVGPSMHRFLPEVEKICSLLTQKKLIYSKSDEVGVVVFGTEETNNELMAEVGGYEHVTVISNIKVVDSEVVRHLQKLPRGISSADYVDAIVVGMDMLIKRYQTTNKGKKRICLITNGIHPTKEPENGSKEDEVNTIASSLASHGIKLESIIIRDGQTKDAYKRIADENDYLLNIISTKTYAKIVHVECSTYLLGALKTRAISPVTIFRGDLEIGSQLKIKVWVYKKTAEEKFPSLKKFSNKASSSDRFATHEVKVDYEYKSVEDSDKIIPPEQRIKGFRYGPQVVPVSDDVLEAIKFKPEKGVKLLGFTDASNILRQYYMKDSSVFIPEPGNNRAILAISALARAMNETNKVAVLRCVWRQGQGSVVLGVLTPNLSLNDSVPDSFYFNNLPFAEDVREFQFPSLSNFPASWQPNEQQQEAADDLVKMFDLAPNGKQEALIPEYTPNPVLERFYRYLELKSIQKDAPIPPIDSTLKKITEPEEELLLCSKQTIKKLRESFDVKENLKIKKSLARKRQHDDKTGDMGEAGEKPDLGDEFEAMKRKIFDLIEDSFDGDQFEDAIERLEALRKGCVVAKEAAVFNEFLRRVVKFCNEKKMSGFCVLLGSKQITLISTSEDAHSDVTDYEAKNFMIKSEPSTD